MSKNIRHFIIIFLTTFLISFTIGSSYAQDRYWVKGTGSWNDPMHWALTSGGEPGASVPSTENNVIFDDNSFTANSQSVVIKEQVECNDFIWQVNEYRASLKSKSFIFKSLTKAQILVYGDILINDNPQQDYYGDINLAGGKNTIVEVSSPLKANIIVDSEGTKRLKSNLNTEGDLVVQSGILDLNNKEVSVNSFIGSGNQKRSIYFGSSKIKANAIDLGISENLTYTTEQLKIELGDKSNKEEVNLGPVPATITKAGAKSFFKIEDIDADSTSCSYTKDGQIFVSVSGGVKPYIYTLRRRNPSTSAWEDTLQLTKPDTTHTFTGLRKNEYIVRVDDSDVSGSQNGVPVHAPDELLAGTITVAQGLSCFDGSDAQLEANPSGGTEPYSYDWYKYNTGTSTYDPIGQFTKIATGLDQGLYQVRVNDDNTCGPKSVDFFFTNPPDNINIPDPISFDNVSSTNSCAGADNGTITLEASGGTGDIDYYLIRQSDLTVIPAGPPYDDDGIFSGLQPDTYETYAIDINDCTKQGSDVVITSLTIPTADAGSGGDECDQDFILNATPSVGVGTWTYTGPGLANFTPNINDPNATVSVDTYGSYDFTWTEDNGGCVDQDQITVNFYENPTANAGSGGDECDQDFDLNATPSVGTGTWTFTGPGAAAFAPNANDPNATVTVTAYGSYDFTWTEDNNGCTDQDQITVNFYEQPVADAGAGGSVCGFDFNLGANPTVGIGTWTYSGPGTISFAPDANDPNAVATADTYGSYTLTWTEVNGTCTDADNINVDYLETPVADAGTGGDECDLDFDLNAAPSVGTGTWTSTGPGAASFAPNANDPNATVTVTAYGSYDFTWTEVNGACSDNDQITVNFYQNPTADAGAGGDECDFDFVFNATPSVGTGTWTYTGPGTANFAPNANDPNATVTVDTYGSYDFTWTEDNNGCIDQDQITVNFYQQPVANAGSGGDECDLDFILNATPSVGTGTWTYTGPGTASFAPNANDPNATVTVTVYGSYDFTWTELNGTCTDNDQITVNFYENPTANAGSGGDECDQDFDLNATPSVGTGTWTFTGPGAAAFAPNANDPNATVTVTAYGSYDFTWTEDNNGCTDQDQITVNFYEQPVADAGAGGSVCGFDFNLGANPTVGIGTWTYSGPGTISFAPDANDPNAVATADTYGSYTLTWTEVNGTCTDADNINVDYLETPVADAGTGGDECDLDFDLNAAPSVGTGTWTSTGPGAASFAPNANDPNATVTVTAYGSYDFTWTEVNGACSDNDQITVNFYQNPTADAGAGGDECDFDFVFNATPSVGTGTWTYTGPGTANFAPNANDPNATVTVDTYGSYDFTWTEDNNGCIDQDQITVNFYQQPVANAGSGGDECDLDFILNATPSVGTGTWTYTGPGTASFAPNANDPNATVTVTVYGSYDFTWTELNGTCTDNDQITVNFYENPTANAGSGGDECDQDFDLNATPSVGTGTWTFTGPGAAAFAPNANDPNATVTVTAYGSYDFTWTEDNNGCTDQDQITVNFYEQPVADAGAGGSVCGFDFNLGANPTVGIGTWTYSGPGTISFAPDANDPNAVATADTYGSYTLTWTEVNGTCTDADIINVDYVQGPTAYAGADSTLCYGSDYTVPDASHSNGTGNVSWSTDGGDGSWTNQTTISPIYTPGANDLLAGFVDLVLTVEANAPCSDVKDTVRVNYLPRLRASIGKPAPYLIDSVSTHIDVYVKMSNHNYMPYLGVYLVSPLDSVVELKPYCTSPFPGNFNTSGVYRFYNDPEDTSAIGAITTCTPTDGRYDFAGAWKKKLQDQDPANGAWRIRIVDNRNFGDFDGLLEEATIKFSDYNASAVFESVLYADSSINKTIKEYSGSGPFAITSHTLPITGLTTSCFGECDAKAVVTASGGQAPYVLFEWSNSLDFSSPFSTNDTVDLCAGTYYVQVTDSHGCVAIDSVTVGEPPEITITNSTVVHNVCYNDSVGEVTLEFSGGTGALTYTHDKNTGAPKNSGETFSGLKADEYTFTITDASGCPKDTTITITEGTEINISTSIDPISCHEAADGEITISASGGTGAGTFGFSIAETPDFTNVTGTFSGLDSGYVYVAVQDANACIKYGDTLYIARPDTITIDSIEVIPTTCSGGGSDGQIVVYASGGSGTLSYSTDRVTFQLNDTLKGLPLGDTTVYVTDSQCDTIKLDSLVTITGPDPIVIDSADVIDVADCFGDNTGQLIIYASGGSGSLEFSINGVDYQDNNTFNNLEAGVYTVSARDKNDNTCTAATVDYTINQPPELTAIGLTVIHTSECNTPQNVGAISFNGSGGTPPYSYTIIRESDNLTTTNPTAGSFTGLRAGDYLYFITDDNGCTSNQLNATIELDPAMDISLEKIDNDCFGLTNGEVSVNFVTGNEGTSPYVYAWEDSLGNAVGSNQTENGLKAGWYYVTVTDSNTPDNCVDVDSIELIDPSKIELNPDPINKRCINSPSRNLPRSLGKVTLAPEGGTPDYTYSWSSPSGFTSTNDTIKNLQPGLYSVTVTDSKGCTTTYSTTLTEDTSFDIPSYNVQFQDSSICWNEDAIFENSFSGEVDSIYYEVEENNLRTTYYEDVTNSPETIRYDIQAASKFRYIKAINDYCFEETRDIDIEFFPSFKLDIIDLSGAGGDTIYLKGATTGALYANVVDSSNISFQWLESGSPLVSNMQTLAIEPDSSAYYTVIATSTDGCVDTSKVFLEFIPAITPNEGFTPNGDGINDLWKIKFIDKFPDNIVTVYNRWGVKVYEQKGYNTNDESRMWDGRAKNGKELASGTYYFVIILNEEGFDPITGPITIIR